MKDIGDMGDEAAVEDRTSAAIEDTTADEDPRLVERVRTGDNAAYAELFARHRGAALNFARTLAGPNGADDLVAEAFARVLSALKRGLGPTVSFRSYLLTSIRSLWANTVRSETRYDLVEDFGFAQDDLALTDDPDHRFDNDAVGAAFRTLPQRWQAVLWYTAVEGLPQAEIAEYLDIKPNAVAALSFRAREGLRQAYLSQHLSTAPDKSCDAMVSLLPAYSRGTLDRRKRPRLEEHLETCLSCAAAAADLRDVNERLGALLLPIVLAGGVGTWGWWHHGSAAAAGAAKVSVTVAAKSALGSVMTAGLVAATVAPFLFLASDHSQSQPDSINLAQAAGSWNLLLLKHADPTRYIPAVKLPTGAIVRGAPVTPRRPVRHEYTAPLAPLPTMVVGGRNPKTPANTRPPHAPGGTPSGHGTHLPGPRLGPLSVARVSTSSGVATILTIPIANLTAGAVLTVHLTHLKAAPVVTSDGWTCTTAGGSSSRKQTARIDLTCTYHGLPTRTPLELSLVAARSGEATVSMGLTATSGVQTETVRVGARRGHA